jgi:hypothetical protein
MRTIDYLNQVRALTPTRSVYAAAALLGLPEGTVRNWHLANSYPDALACAKIAELLDVPLERVLADVELEREKNPERRAYWEQLARKFAACLVMGLAITTWPSDGRSAIGAETTQAIDLLQIMRRLVRATTNTRLCNATWSHIVQIMRRILARLRHELHELRFGRFPGFAS